MRKDKNKESRRKTPLGIEKRFDRFGEWLDTSWAMKMTMPVLHRYPAVLVAMTWLMRLFVGGTFIVSGLSKAIDPWGGYYKMTEYLTAMHLPIEEWGNTVLAMTVALFSVEFLVGVSLFTGCFRKAAPIMAALFMLAMLPLTLWIAIADPVADCGCFGDFLVISNWTTFAKNVILSLATVWLLKFNRNCVCLISPYLQWVAAVSAGCYIATVGYIGYWQQPLIDFRPYGVGKQLLAVEDEAEYVPVFDFIYEKDGEERVFSESDELPEESDGWRFVRREEKEMVRNESATAGAASDTPDFRIWNESGDEDVTDRLSASGRQMMLLIPDISELSMAMSWKINRLYDMARQEDMDFFAVAAGSREAIEEWRDLSSGQYPIYTAEDTSIKALARGIPALISLDGGKIEWKTALSGLNLKDDDSEITGLIETGVNRHGGETLTGLSVILVSILAALALGKALSHAAPFSKRRCAEG